MGPNTEAGGKSAYNNVQVGGAPTQKLAESQLTIMCKLAGPNIKKYFFFRN
ncbi:Nitrogen regulation protein NIFR3 [Staphylococcus aureus subsp. aureus CN1]|nr:Nitrogen regulation protein NIFR3 [Staphylococcus aureus subsp. aureus CN1]BAR08332.1 nitrogen regulation protein NIFR3 [Staphylococcus aureus]BAR11056.1 nitrogen regulation protein NIFR3 [Staphylococcus aureus]